MLPIGPSPCDVSVRGTRGVGLAGSLADLSVHREPEVNARVRLTRASVRYMVPRHTWRRAQVQSRPIYRRKQPATDRDQPASALGSSCRAAELMQ
jgi:hypothetical protein